jgi:lipoprotein-anchoring transpeptidase ErfK/SrfK
MSRFTTSRLSISGLLLLSTLAVIPTSIHAETKPQKAVDSIAPTPTAPQTLTNRPATIVPAIAKPLTGASSSIPSQPATNNLIPAAGAKSTIAGTNDRQPVSNVVNLLLKLNERKVYVYKGDKVIAKYPVAIGKKGWETPTGEWYVMEKITNPGWTSFKNGQVTKPGPKNPLGERWIGFWTDGQDVIGFHGTPSVKSIGTAASHGCVRMFDKDVKELFPLVQVGTTVKVVNE